ncbi:MAG: 30S ribosomal protein S20 [Candidatus Yanofskybacteria bacterium]|nr:30S ribosomal protein S20 [Candidatus Yanofskybacteria bacterium]
MPNIQSAEKALRQSKTRRVRNLQKKEAFKDAFKNLKKLAAAGKTAEAKELLATVYKKVDKAAKTNVIAKNKAARLKSQASRLIATK